MENLHCCNFNWKHCDTFELAWHMNNRVDWAQRIRFTVEFHRKAPYVQITIFNFRVRLKWGSIKGKKSLYSALLLHSQHVHKMFPHCCDIVSLRPNFSAWSQCLILFQHIFQMFRKFLHPNCDICMFRQFQIHSRFCVAHFVLYCIALCAIDGLESICKYNVAWNFVAIRRLAYHP